MACATLKRSLEFDPVYHRPSKRQRCSVTSMCAVSPGGSGVVTSTSSRSGSLPQKESPFGEIANKLTPGNYRRPRPFSLSLSIAHRHPSLSASLLLSLTRSPLYFSLSFARTHTFSCIERDRENDKSGEEEREKETRLEGAV